MRPRAEDLDRVARSVVRTLIGREYAHRLKDEALLVRRAAAVILDSFEREAEIEREAERMAAVHARQMGGMDQRKIIQGIKARIAEEKNFPL